MLTNPQDDAATLEWFKHINPDHDKIWRDWDDLGRKGNRTAGNGGVRVHTRSATDRGSSLMRINADGWILVGEIGTIIGSLVASAVVALLLFGVI